MQFRFSDDNLLHFLLHQVKKCEYGLLLRSKVMLVGQGEAGKTSLRAAMFEVMFEVAIRVP